MRRFDLQLFAEEEAGDRTEPPTPRKRERARREGQFPRSAELTGALLLLGGTALLVTAGRAAQDRLTSFLAGTWEGWLARGPRVGELGLPEAQGLLLRGLQAGAMAVAPFLVATVAVSVASGLAQSRFALTGSGLVPKLSRINPLAGLQRLFSLQALVELLKALLKLGLIAGLTYGAVRTAVEAAPGLLGAPLAGVLQWLYQGVARLFLEVGLAWLVVAAGDYAYQFWSTEKRLRMTPYELQRELRETEGNPEVKRRIRRLQAQMAAARMIEAVRRARVVVANPTHFAVALAYEPERMEAPQVVARGADELALRIRAEAWRRQVPIVEDPPLARALYASTRVGQTIPVHLYKAVAEVMAWVWQLERGGTATWRRR
ncbi:MAG: EscU/YscU/HrcU family type III secretion system export apparatus switch protein [Bacillota bacterium]|nr:EscU/YscU/HrcU family type III secretion system export apparatus switch protein [Bacillota bacterium]